MLRLSCVVHGLIYGRFMGFYVNGFLSVKGKGKPLYKEETVKRQDLISSFFYNCFWSLETVQTKKVQNIPLSATNCFSQLPCDYIQK